jgi:chromosome segregation ATPase
MADETASNGRTTLALLGQKIEAQNETLKELRDGQKIILAKFESILTGAATREERIRANNERLKKIDDEIDKLRDADDEIKKVSNAWNGLNSALAIIGSIIGAVFGTRKI